MGELGSPPFWVSKWGIEIKTLPLKLPPLESQHYGLLNCGKDLIPIPHFDTQNGGEPNSPILMGQT